MVFDYVTSEVAELIEGTSPAYDAFSATKALQMAIDTYYRTVDRIQDSVVFMYQETKELRPDARKAVFEMERRLSSAFERILDRGCTSGEFKTGISPLIAQNIVILGHMWPFRQWLLGKRYAYVLEDHIKEQTDFILGAIREGKQTR